MIKLTEYQEDVYTHYLVAIVEKNFIMAERYRKELLRDLIKNGQLKGVDYDSL